MMENARTAPGAQEGGWGDAVSLLWEESFCTLGRARSSQDVSIAGALNCTSKLGLEEVSVNPEKQVNICQSQLTPLLTPRLEGFQQAQRGALLIY